MLSCPTCGATFGYEQRFCGADGTALIDPAVDRLLGVRVGARFRLGPVLRRGGFGSVLQGVDEQDGQPVAVKILHADRATNPQIVERFHREARALASVRHPHVVGLTGYGYDETAGWFLVMPLLQGETLFERTQRAGMLSLQELDLLVTQLLGALQHIHALGIIHRDIKAENVFLETPTLATAPGEVGLHARLLDFGVARLMPNTKVGVGLHDATLPRQVVGSPLTMSPEQVIGDKVDVRSDLYSFGVLLFEALTGELPFRNDKPGLVMRAHVHEPPPPPSQRGRGRWVPPSLDTLVLDLMQKRPGLRPSSAEETLARWRRLLPELRLAWHHDGRVTSPMKPGTAADR